MTTLSSFKTPINALVVGASGGIGHAITQELLASPNVAAVTTWSRRTSSVLHDKLTSRSVDITCEADIAAATTTLPETQFVFVATGLLHDGADLQPEKTWRTLNAEQLIRIFAVNTIGPALVAKHTLPRLPRHERAIFAAISARVGSISDNHLGGWYGYRASKAALNQMVRTFSIELARKSPEAICVALHPGTVDTALSAPFKTNIAEKNLFTSGHAASQLLNVLDGLTPHDTGNLFAWDSQRIPF